MQILWRIFSAVRESDKKCIVLMSSGSDELLMNERQKHKIFL